MIRETLDAGSNQMFVAAYSNNVFGDYRTTLGAYNTYNYDPAGTGPPPYWVELVRTGSSFAGYASPDGISWTLVAGPLPIDMAQNVYIGLGVSSGSTAGEPVLAARGISNHGAGIKTMDCLAILAPQHNFAVFSRAFRKNLANQ